MSFRKEGVEGGRTRATPGYEFKKLLVTGCCGFIGSNFVNYMLDNTTGLEIYNLDKLDYCANTKSIEKPEDPRYHFIKGDIQNTDLVMHVLQEGIDCVINFAAQSHVDNSFGNSLAFTRNNVLGTHNLLECCRVYGRIEKFIHVSTDEVYGEVDSSQHEGGVLNPTNPYAASKAAAEFIAKSYAISFGMPIVITRGNNVYGPYQYPEKVIPRFIYLLHNHEKMTIQGSGQNSRTFIHAHDVARAFHTILERGELFEVYNIGSRDEHSVIEIATRLLALIRPGASLADWTETIPDRQFNDQRYDINSDKLKALGWNQTIDFDQGLPQVVDWYRNVAFADPANPFWPVVNKKINTATETYHQVS